MPHHPVGRGPGSPPALPFPSPRDEDRSLWRFRPRPRGPARQAPGPVEPRLPARSGVADVAGDVHGDQAAVVRRDPHEADRHPFRALLAPAILPHDLPEGVDDLEDAGKLEFEADEAVLVTRFE